MQRCEISEFHVVKASRGDRMTFQETVGTGLLLFAINTKQKPFDDVRVRKALTIAVDRWNGVAPLSKITSFKGRRYTIIAREPL